MEEDTINIIFIGIDAVGVTKLALRFVCGFYSEGEGPTVYDEYDKTVNIDGKDVKIKIIETSEYDDGIRFWKRYPKRIFMLVYSIADLTSFDHLYGFKEGETRFLEKGEELHIVVVGTRCDDEEHRKVTKEEGEEFAKSIDAPFYEVSAKTGYNVETLFIETVRKFMRDAQKHQEGEKEKEENKEKKEKCNIA